MKALLGRIMERIIGLRGGRHMLIQRPFLERQHWKNEERMKERDKPTAIPHPDAGGIYNLLEAARIINKEKEVKNEQTSRTDD